MKSVGMIPARMNSTRFPGKALVTLDGIPMIVRVFFAAKESGVLDEVFVVTDSSKIAAVCKEYQIPVLMTSAQHKNPTSRTAEAASFVKADYYVMIGGDEPLLSPDDIRQVVKKGISSMQQGAFAANAMGRLVTKEEAADPSNIKVCCDPDGYGISAFRVLSKEENEALHKEPGFFSSLRKFVSIGIYSQEALRFFVSTKPGEEERRVQFDLLRFLEHRKKIFFLETTHHTLSVDTPNDLEEVQHLLSAQKQEKFY